MAWCWYKYEKVRIAFCAEIYGWSAEKVFDHTCLSMNKQLNNKIG